MQLILDKIIHAFLPNKCMFCHAPIEYDKTVCDVCAKNAPLTPKGICLACGRKKCACEDVCFTELICPFYYEMGVDIAIQDMKFNQNRLNARKLALYMAKALKEKEYYKNIDVILPAPMHSSDKNKRGYNQANLLAKWLSKYTDIPCYEDVLIKTRKTKKQHELNFADRQSNLEDAFAIVNQEMYQRENNFTV